MKKRQRVPNATQKLACALLHIPNLIPPELRDKDANTIARSVEWDHWPILFSNGGSCDPQNLRPLTIAQHAIETATKTIPALAKGKRIREKEGRHKKTMRTLKLGIEMLDETAPFFVQGGFDKVAQIVETKQATRTTKRKMQGRPFQGSRKFNGQIKWRTEKK